MPNKLAAVIASLSIAVCVVSFDASCSRPAPSTSESASVSQSHPWSGYEAAATYAAERGKTVYNVTYQPETVLFDQQSTERALKNISADGATYTLDASVPAAAQLKAGSVLFLYGIAIRKVTAVATQGSTVIVTTSDGDITDAIKDGHIEWQMPIDFAGAGFPDKLAQSYEFENVFVTPVLAASPVAFPKVALGGVQDKIKFQITIGFEAGHLGIDLQGTYTGPDAIIEFHGSGSGQLGAMTGALDISGGLIDQFNAGLAGMQGHVDFDWSGAMKDSGSLSAIDRDFKIKLPDSWCLKAPFWIGGIPFVAEGSAAVIIHPAFTSKSAITHGHFSLDYSGSQGVTVGAAPPAPQGNMVGKAAVGEGMDVTTSLGPMGFTAALELPRVEVSLAILAPSGFSDLAFQLKDNVFLNAMKKYPGWENNSGHDIDKFIKQFALPIKPYAYNNIVTSTGKFTNGALTTSLVAMPPCERSQIIGTANAGVGVKLNFRNASKIFNLVQTQVAPKLEFTIASPSWRYPVTVWKNNIKCPDDK